MADVFLELFFPSNSLRKAGIEGRDEIEDPLNEALEEAGLGRVIGGGSGIYGSDIAVSITDETHFDMALALIRRVLRDTNAPRDTRIRRPEPVETIYLIDE